jgi:hypothetical protein
MVIILVMRGQRPGREKPHTHEKKEKKGGEEWRKNEHKNTSAWREGMEDWADRNTKRFSLKEKEKGGLRSFFTLYVSLCGVYFTACLLSLCVCVQL